MKKNKNINENIADEDMGPLDQYQEKSEISPFWNLKKIQKKNNIIKISENSLYKFDWIFGEI